MRSESCFQMAANWPEIGKKTMASQFADMTSLSTFFDVAVFLLSSLVVVSWFRLHINIMTGPGVMTIFAYKELTRNPEIRNTPV